MLHVEKFDYNSLDDLISNTYIIYDDNKAVVIDPGASNDSVSKFLESRHLSLKAILLTHGHVDHIRGVNNLANKYNCPVYIHADDIVMLMDTYLNCSEMLHENVVVSVRPLEVRDNDLLSFFKDEEIKVIHTPFHTKGSICYYFVNNRWLFSGDTLFKNSVGRDDLPNSAPNKMNESLEKIKKLPEDAKIYPGHGPNTVLKSELMLNRFLIK